MPRRTPDQGVRPFEVRTGVGGMPPLGGIHRSGDPATIPLHRHHLIINGRITPAGLTERPGLAVVHSSGIAECIVGITESRRLAGGIVLWPGVTEDNGNGLGALSAISMRTIFPTVSLTYSEYNILMEGAVSDEACFSSQPIIEFDVTTSVPFIYEAQIHYWKSGANGWECWTVPMPESAETLGTDIYRAKCCYDINGVPPDPNPVAPDPCPPGTAWPRGHPFSTSEFVFRLPADPFGTGSAGVAAVLAVPERGDQALNGNLVVQESLYILVTGSDGVDSIGTKVFRWDGISLTEEAATIPSLDVSGTEDYKVSICAGGGKIYVCLGGNDTTGNGGALSVRGEDGTWVAATDGLRDGATTADFYPFFAFVWEGVPYVFGLSIYFKNFLGGISGIVLATPVGGELVVDTSPGIDATVVPHARQIGPWIYLLGYGEDDGTIAGCQVQVFDMVSRALLPSYVNVEGHPSLYTKSRWIEVIGTTVYLGGSLPNDLVLVAPEPEGCHSVYDITDPAAVGLIYRVYDSLRPEFGGDTYSQGALPVMPASGETREEV